MAEANRVPWRWPPAARIAAALLGGAFAAMLGCGGAYADVLGGYYYTDTDTGNLMYAEPDGSTLYADPETGYVLDTSSGDYVNPTTLAAYSVDSSTGAMAPLSVSGNTSSTVEVDDPPTLHIGQSVSSCPQGATGVGSCGYADKSDKDLITLSPSSTVDIYQNSTSGSPAGATPLGEITLVIAVPNDAALSFSVSSPTEYNQYNTGSTSCNTNSQHTSANTQGECGAANHTTSVVSMGSSGEIGEFTAGDGYSDLYDYILGTEHYPTGTGDTTTSFNNLAQAEEAATSAAGYEISPTNFGVYVYTISSAIFGANDLISMVTSNLPYGSIVLGFGGTVTQSGQWTKYTYYTTPLSQGGIVTYLLPEPGSLSVLASSLAGLGFLSWRRRRRPSSGGVADAANSSRGQEPA